MTVRELIKKLKEHDLDKDIVLNDSEWGEHDCKEIEIRDWEILLV